MHVVVLPRRTFVVLARTVSAVHQVPDTTRKLSDNPAEEPTPLGVCLAHRHKKQFTDRNTKHRTRKAPLPHGAEQTLRLEHVCLVGGRQQLDDVCCHQAQNFVSDEGGDGCVRLPALDRRQVHRVLQGRGAVSVEANRNVGGVHGQGEWSKREDGKGGE